MDEIGIGALDFQNRTSKFSFGSKKRTKNLPENPSKVQKLDVMASAEEKFDALFGSPTPAVVSRIPKLKLNCTEEIKVPAESTSVATPVKEKDDPLTIAVSVVKRWTPEKKKFTLSARSPFALAFGSTNLSDDSEDEMTDFGTSGFTANSGNDKTAEQCWDEMMITFEEDEKPKKKKTLKLSTLARGKNEKPLIKKDVDVYDDFDGDGYSLSLADSKEKEVPPKSQLIEEKQTKNGEKNPKAKGRERRFFKGRTKEHQQKYLIASFTESAGASDDKELFKMPTLPIGNKKDHNIDVPETARLTEGQMEDKELADDLRFYLDGLKDSSDINLRALSALGFAKKCQENDFRKFLGDKKLSKKNRAHNFGQHVLLHLRDATKPTKSSHSFALAAALAMYKACTDKRIGISKYIFVVLKQLLELKLKPLPESSESDRREFHRMQTSASELMKPLKPMNGTSNWDYKTVVSETLVNLASTCTKQLFNALMFVSGLLEHVTNRLIDIVNIDNVNDLEMKHFDRVFTAFAEQTKPPYIKCQELVMVKTDISSSFRKFLDILDPKIHFKEGGCADRIMMHIASMCTYSPKQNKDNLAIICNRLARDDFVAYCLKMLNEIANQLGTRDENKHTRKVGIAILLNLVAFSPLARAKVQQAENMNLICDVLKEEKGDLLNLHDGNITIDMNQTRIRETLEESEKNMMSDEDQVAYGGLVSKANMHVGGVVTIGYAALIIAHLIKANEFILPKIKQQLDENCFKLSLDCFDEMLNICSASGKEDEKCKALIRDAREIFNKHGYH